MRAAGAALGGPGHSGDDAEDGAESVVDAVDGVADPTGGLGLALGARGHQIVEGALGLVGVELGGRQVVADEVAQGDVVLALVLDHLVEDVDGGRIAELLDLMAVAGDVSALVEFQAAQRKVEAADAVGERVGVAGFAAVVLGDRRAEGGEAAGPEIGVVLLGQGKVVQRTALLRVDGLTREGIVGVKAAHLRLPVVGERFDEMFLVPGVHA